MSEGLVSLLTLADSRLPAGGHAHSGGVEPAIATGLIRDLDDLAVFLRSRLRTTGLVSAALAAAACHRAGYGHSPPPNRTFTPSGHTAGVGSPVNPESPVRDGGTWAALDAEADARTASPAQRVASRQQGRALLRAGRAAWPSPLLGTLAACPPATYPVPNRTFGENGATDAGRMPGSPESPVWEGRAPQGPHHPVALGAVGAAAGCDPAGVAHVAAYLAISGPAAAAVRLRGYDPFAVQALLASLTADVAEVARQAAEAAPGPLSDLPCATAPRLDLLAELHAVSEVRLFAS